MRVVNLILAKVLGVVCFATGLGWVLFVRKFLSRNKSLSYLISFKFSSVNANYFF